MTRPLERAIDALAPVAFDNVSLSYKARQFLRGHARTAEHAHVAWR